MKRMLLYGCSVLAVVVVTAAVARADDKACLECHGNRAALEKARTDPKRPVAPLLVDGARQARSVHADVGCTDCHDGYDAFPHGSEGTTMSCRECHEDLGKDFAQGVHNQPRKDGKGPIVTCVQCHGAHGILPPTDRASRLFPLNVYQVCGKCHFKHDPAHSTVQQMRKEKYADDAHARGILEQGLAVSATCVSCHGSHGIRRAGDPDSRLARVRVDKVCGTCHIGVLEAYRQSIHFLKSTGPAHKGATCTDCHKPHDIDVRTEAFLTSAVAACSGCHEERASSFRQSFHGKVTTLGNLVYGQKHVATCEVCHGHHKILPESDPRSTINPANRLQTCRQCHKDATPEFARYEVHADPSDAARNPGLHLVYVGMNGLLIGTLILGCLHALMWLVRSLAAGEWRRPRPAAEVVRWFRRWPTSYVVFHIWMMTTVLVLATTGLPLHFADQPWAQDVMGFLGGPPIAGFLHRTAAVLLVLLFVTVFVQVGHRFLKKHEKGLFWGPDSMVPRRKDLADLWGNLKWFLFLAPRPRYDRWTYWEKFDFWAATWGLFVIGITGLILWFPEQATHLVPAWCVNASVVVHGIEALLDIAFIFTVHVFHANLRPDKFPMDTIFLTGRITEAEFRHERPEEYERAVREGRLESLLASRPRRRTRATAYVIGTCALAVGFFFVGAMIVAVLSKLG
jgi:cytochrome b subunit of formate dehydrogenase